MSGGLRKPRWSLARALANGRPARPAALARAVAVFALTLAVAATPLGGRSVAPAASPGPIGTIRPVGYDVAARYDPRTTVLEVTCAMEFEVLRDLSRLGVYLRSYFGPPEIASGPGMVSWAPGRVSDDWRYYSTSTPCRAGQRVSTTWTYKGTPVVYDPSQDRYWSRARAEAIWVTETGCWLPSPDSRWSTSDCDFRLRVTVPADWTVFAPGRRAAAEPAAEEGWRTFDFASSRGEANTSCWWIAGPYFLDAKGEVAGVPYSVWSLPGWEREGARLAEETPRMIGFLGEVLGRLPPIEMRVVLIHPDQGGGVSSGEGLTAMSPRGTNSKFGLASLEALWTHEFAHSLAYFGDEGWSEFLALYYIASDYPERYPAELEAARSYFLGSVGKHGDFAVKEATRRHFESGDIPEWHAYVYVKPALVWNMYRGLFGEEALRLLLVNLQEDYAVRDWSAPTGDWANPSLWDEFFSFYRDEAVAAAEATGSSGAAAGAFFDRWLGESYRLDLALEEVSCTRPAASGEAATPGGAGEWTVSFAIRDVRESPAPPANESIPWVEVAVAVGGGRPLVTRVNLTGGVTRATVSVPARPLKVTLDPAKWLLDYDYSNNAADVAVPATLAEILRVAVPAATVVVAGVVALWLLRRRPKDLKAPPMAGQAR